jgi:hypothetical protein
MGAGRPPEGAGQVERLRGEAQTKRRLRLLLSTLSGECSVEEACRELGLSPARLFELRRQALQAALEALNPKVSGRPPQGEEEDALQLTALERENRALKLELQAAYVRTELALSMPQLLTKQAQAEIKKKARRAQGAVRRGSGGDGAGT